MGRLFSYTFTLVGIHLLLFLFGAFGTQTPDTFIGSILNPTNFFDSIGIAEFIVAITAVGLVGAVLTGNLFIGNIEVAAKILFIGFLVGLGTDYIRLLMVFMNSDKGVFALLSVIIFLPVIFMYSVVLMEFWTGRD
jgi:hypothetical protein